MDCNFQSRNLCFFLIAQIGHRLVYRFFRVRTQQMMRAQKRLRKFLLSRQVAFVKVPRKKRRAPQATTPLETMEQEEEIF